MHNRKMLKSVVSIVLTFVMIMALTPKSQAAEPFDYDHAFDAKARATEASELLMAHFAESGFYSDYPDYYAGCYIGDDCKFHIRLCSPTQDVLEMLAAIFEEYSDVIVYEYSDFSWSEMFEYVDTLAYELIELGYGITLWGVDDFTGNVIIEVLEEDLSEVRSLVEGQQTYAAGNSCPDIILNEGEYAQSAAGYQPGTSNGNILLGGYGYYNGNKAIVTCGHGGHSAGDTFTFGNVSGYYTVQQCEEGENGDYSIGIITSNSPLRHGFGSSGIAMTGYAYSPVAGSDIRAYRSNGSIVRGTVLYKDQSVPTRLNAGETDYVHLEKMTIVSITSGSVTYGDSGAPCITYANGFCGVLSSYNDLVTRFYFTPNTVLRSAGFTVFAEHYTSTWQPYSGEYHVGYCSDCQDEIYEAHWEYWDETTIPYCTRCGYVA